jgi:hypothetical protein
MAPARPIGAVVLAAVAVLYAAHAAPHISGQEAAVLIALLAAPLVLLWRG